MFTHSVCSYPQRGNYGKSGYRGNCTGYIIRDFVESYLAPEGLFADQFGCCGGNGHSF